MKTADVRELLPRAVDEAVHRDYFVLGAEAASAAGYRSPVTLG